MKRQVAFVLGGGGSRGALQVGALAALLEHGLQPDFMIGTSIGSVNSAFLALHGYSKASLERLTVAWRQVAELDLLPVNYFWLTARAMFRRSPVDPSQRIKDYFISQGITPELRFGEVGPPRLLIVSSDLNSAQPVIYGDDPDEKVLEAVLLSTTLPPWVMPVKKDDRYLMDGAIVSSVPIEPALTAGASAIVALDIVDIRDKVGIGPGIATFLDKLTMAVEKRQVHVELELAQARGIPTIYMGLVGKVPIPFWDFQHSDEMIAQGYEIACQVLDAQSDLTAFL